MLRVNLHQIIQGVILENFEFKIVKCEWNT